MKNVKVKKEKKDKKIALTGNFAVYMVVFVAALIFTQALRSKASNIFFGFVFFLPWVMLIYAVTSRSTLKIFMLCESAEVAKNQPYDYKLRLVNESIIPYPFVDAMMWLPQANSVRCALRTVKMAFSPLSDYTVNNSVAFRFRGTYEIGVENIYVYDFLRMFRVKVDMNVKETVYVMPRKLNMDIGEANAISDSANKTQKSNNSYEKIEISDIREYRSGDALKSIHWKLSSKSEDFMVREYDTGSSRETYIFCDMSANFATEPPRRLPETPLLAERAAKIAKKKADRAAAKRKEGEDSATAVKQEGDDTAVDISALAQDSYYDDMNEYCADGVIELTVASVLKELRGGSECTLLWFDRRSDSGFYCFTLHGKADFDAIFRLFATAPLCSPEDSVVKLASMLSDSSDLKRIYITSNISPEAVRQLCAMPALADAGATGAAELILYNPMERFAHPKDRKLYIEGCREQLMTRGLRLTEGLVEQGG